MTEQIVRCRNGEEISASEYRDRYRAEREAREEFWAKRESDSPFTAPLLNQMNRYRERKRDEREFLFALREKPWRWL